MAVRIEPLVTDEYYHVFNRGVAKQPIFTSKHDYSQALLTSNYYQYADQSLKLSRFKKLSYEDKEKFLSESKGLKPKLVQIVCFVFMPNHFHFLLKQLVDNGISKFIGQFCNSYTRYFNTVHNRVGHVFQGTFKSINVESEEQLIHLTRYIHLNPYVSSIVKKNTLSEYPWSSYPNYLQGGSNIIGMNPEKYRQFVVNHADYARELELIKHQTLDLE